MRHSSTRVRNVLALILILGGCNSSDSGGAVSANGPGAPTAKGSGDAGQSDATGSSDPSNVGAGLAVEYAVPSAGGSVMVSGKSGAQISFSFPASASGRMVTLTPTTASDIGRTDGQFAEVIRMEPDGSHFADPIVVRPASKALLLLDFPSSPAHSTPDPLALNDLGDGLLLSHFSTLAIVPSDYACVSSAGWQRIRTAEAQANCTDPDFPSYLSFGCQAYEFCLSVDAHCCAPDGATACELGNPNLALNYTAIESDSEDTQNCTAPAEAAPAQVVCDAHDTLDCKCDGDVSGTQQCLEDGSGYTDCACQAAEPQPEPTPEYPTATCPEFHEDDCSVTDASTCACSTSDSEHSYTISCSSDNASCSCQIDGEEVATFMRTDAVCETRQSVRAQWYTHCTEGTCP